jgi:hypothetical protein
MCTVKVDATEAVARVIFDNDDDLGVLKADYVIGQPITVEKGRVEYIQVYNGNSAGYLNFRVSFSSAEKVQLWETML